MNQVRLHLVRSLAKLTKLKLLLLYYYIIYIILLLPRIYYYYYYYYLLLYFLLLLLLLFYHLSSYLLLLLSPFSLCFVVVVWCLSLLPFHIYLLHYFYHGYYIRCATKFLFYETVLLKLLQDKDINSFLSSSLLIITIIFSVVSVVIVVVGKLLLNKIKNRFFYDPQHRDRILILMKPIS